MHTLFRPASFVLIILLIFVNSLFPQMVADIKTDIETRFGTYHPYSVQIEPDMDLFDIDTSKILNFQQFDFTEEQIRALQQNGFFVTPGRTDNQYTGYYEIYDIYKECKDRDIPIFVTTDALLHTYHLIYNGLLKYSEQRYFYDQLVQLTNELQEYSIQTYQQSSDSLVREAAKINTAFFTVGKYFLDETIPIPGFVDSLVQAEIELIQNKAGFSLSPIFKYRDDYSQFKVRGHYTQTDTLSRYFKTMMWFGKMTFALERLDMKFIRKITLAALLDVKAIATLSAESQSLFELWESLYLPTVFFVGRADDIHFYNYLKIAREVYGENFFSLTPEAIADTNLLNQFISEAQGLPGPKITTFAPKGWRFMGQRFVPDSYILDQVVYPHVDGRLMPKGLDVMATLGSKKAEELLREIGTFDYPGYENQLNKMKNYIASQPDSAWVQTLYWNWLYTLMPMLFEKGEGYPAYMQNIAWIHKDLAAALASWGELRHDTILYVKQSQTWVTIPPEYPAQQGFVEPNPFVYARLAALTEYTRVGLNNFNLLTSFSEQKLIRLKNLLLRLKTISEKELSNQPLTVGEYKTIHNIGEKLETLANFEDGVEFEFFEPADSLQMPVVADVHTDPNSGQALEEGVGYPLSIYVVNEIGGELFITKGAAYAYYEFEQPIDNRLTDEQWREMLTGTDYPEPVWWSSEFTYPDSQGYYNPNPWRYYPYDADYVFVGMELLNDQPKVGDTLNISASVPTYLSVNQISILPPGDENWRVVTIPENNMIQIATTDWSAGKVKTRIEYESDGKDGLYLMDFELQEISGLENNKQVQPQRIVLIGNYPNPFNPETTIEFYLPQREEVQLKIYNLLGQEVRTLLEKQEKAAGNYQFTWDGKSDLGKELPSGVYLIRMKINNNLKTRKMVLVR